MAERFHMPEIVVMRVPPAERDFHERHAALHKSAGEQAALAEAVAAVAIAQLVIFIG